MVLRPASDTASAAPTAAGTSAGGLPPSTGAQANRADVEAAHRSGQQAHIGQHREAAADAGVVFHHLDVVRAEHDAQAVACARLGRLGDAEEMLVRIEL